ncbi:unnamed protein product [Merluccius merluccius]
MTRFSSLPLPAVHPRNFKSLLLVKSTTTTKMASKRAARGKGKAKAKARAPIDDATRILGDDDEEEDEQQPCNLGDDGEDGDDGPVVFFCGKCNLLVGDSLSWAGSDDESQIQLTRRDPYVLGSAGQEAAAESPLEQPLTVEDRGSVEQQLLKMKSLVVSMAHRLEEVEEGGRRQVDLDESEP